MLYLASPYSAPIPAMSRRRFEIVCECAGFLMAGGLHVFSPIAHSHPIAISCNLGLGWDYWAEFDRKMIEMCDQFAVLMLPAWEDSVGVRAEIQIARELGRVINGIEFPFGNPPTIVPMEQFL